MQDSKNLVHTSGSNLTGRFWREFKILICSCKNINFVYIAVRNLLFYKTNVFNFEDVFRNAHVRCIRQRSPGVANRMTHDTPWLEHNVAALSAFQVDLKHKEWVLDFRAERTGHYLSKAWPVGANSCLEIERTPVRFSQQCAIYLRHTPCYTRFVICDLCTIFIFILGLHDLSVNCRLCSPS